jgi:hypothetical protein
VQLPKGARGVVVMSRYVVPVSLLFAVYAH